LVQEFGLVSNSADLSEDKSIIIFYAVCVYFVVLSIHQAAVGHTSWEVQEDYL
jgi:hypothetical protein